MLCQIKYMYIVKYKVNKQKVGSSNGQEKRNTVSQKKGKKREWEKGREKLTKQTLANGKLFKRWKKHGESRGV